MMFVGSAICDLVAFVVFVFCGFGLFGGDAVVYDFSGTKLHFVLCLVAFGCNCYVDLIFKTFQFFCFFFNNVSIIMFWLIQIPDDVKIIIMSYLRKSINGSLKDELHNFKFLTFENLVRRQLRSEKRLCVDGSIVVSEETKNRIRIMSSLRCE